LSSSCRIQCPAAFSSGRSGLRGIGGEYLLSNKLVTAGSDADHAREAGAFICAGAEETEVVINNDNLICVGTGLNGQPEPHRLE
jgi:hypothetical protein